MCTYLDTLARAALARVTLARMSEALALQMNGFGSMCVYVAEGLWIKRRRVARELLLALLGSRRRIFSRRPGVADLCRRGLIWPALDRDDRLLGYSLTALGRRVGAEVHKQSRWHLLHHPELRP